MHVSGLEMVLKIAATWLDVSCVPVIIVLRNGQKLSIKAYPELTVGALTQRILEVV